MKRVRISTCAEGREGVLWIRDKKEQDETKHSHGRLEEIGLYILGTCDRPDFAHGSVFRVDIASCHYDADLLYQAREDGEIPPAPVSAGGDDPSDGLIRDRAAVAQSALVILEPLMQVVQYQTGLNVGDGLSAGLCDGEGGGKGVGPDLPGRGTGEIGGGVSDTGSSERFRVPSCELGDQENVGRRRWPED